MLIRLLVVNMMLFSFASAATLSAPRHARVDAIGELSLLAATVRGDSEHLVHVRSHTAAHLREASDGTRKLRREVHSYKEDTEEASTRNLVSDQKTSMPVSDQKTSADRFFGSSCSIPDGMRAVKTSAGFMMVVLGDDDVVSESFSKRGFWEVEKPDDMIPPDMKGKMTLPAHGTLLDIGANIGDYTMLFASKGYNVIAVEPMTRNRAAMQATLCLNPEFKERVKVVTAALVAPDEVANAKCVIEANKDNIGDGNLKCGKEADITKLNAVENVPVKTLDTALAELNVKAVDIVKMDVESYECHVLAGGESLFTKYRPKILQVETLWGHSAECVKHMSSKYSYTAFNTGDNADTTMVARPIF